MENVNALSTSEAAPQLGIDPKTLKKRCQRGRVPGAFKEQDGKLEKWFIPMETIRAHLNESGHNEYETLYDEWVRCMERGLGYKKPISPRGVEANVYGMEKFWLFVEDPPKEIRSGRRKDETKATPKRQPNLHDMTLDNLCVAIANVPLDRVKRNCHFSMKDCMYKGFRSFFKFLARKGLRTRAELTDLVEANPVRIYEEKREFLSQEQLLSLLEKNENTITGRHDADFDAMANKVIIMLAAFAGLRLDDIVSLEIRHIDLAQQELVVVDGKGNKRREVAFNTDVRDVLHLWLGSYRPKSRNQRLLLAKDGDPFTDDMAYKRMRRLGTHPHALRRTCASIAIEQGVPIHHISEMFGHTRTSTTEKSYVNVSKRQAKASFKSLSIAKTSSSPKTGAVDLIDAL